MIWMAGGTVVLTALTVLGIIAKRPGPYPGGLVAKLIAVLALGAVVPLLNRRRALLKRLPRLFRS